KPIKVLGAWRRLLVFRSRLEGQGIIRLPIRNILLKASYRGNTIYHLDRQDHHHRNHPHSPYHQYRTIPWSVMSQKVMIEFMRRTWLPGIKSIAFRRHWRLLGAVGSCEIS